MKTCIDSKVTYIDILGRIYYVGQGLGGPVGSWFTLRRKLNGSSERVKSPNLPLRDDKPEAQRDLDEFAKRNGLEKMRDEDATY